MHSSQMVYCNYLVMIVKRNHKGKIDSLHIYTGDIAVVHDG